MVAYNFKRRFVEPIRAGTKRQTLRKQGKRRHAMPGEKLQLYTGQRTKSCEKILEEDPTCLGTATVVVRCGLQTVSVNFAGKWLTANELVVFARSEGFAGPADFHQYWLDNHGTGDHELVAIRWDELPIKLDRATRTD